MFTLMMALTAGLTLGSGPEPVSAETEPVLNLRGRWVGVWTTSERDWEVHVLGETWSYQPLPRGRRDPAYLTPQVRDEGKGRVRLNWNDVACLGIYEQKGDRLTICFRAEGHGRPTSFRVGDGQTLLALRRVK
jgi:hypothetical protein